MAEETKPVEVPVAETAAPVAEPTTEAAPAAAEPVAAEPAAAEAASAEPAVEAAPAAEAATEEAKKEEPPKPVEEGILEAKGGSFPKNFIYSKKYFWFGSDAIELKDASAAKVGHSVAAWAAETGKGLLFYGEKPGEKSAPHGAIQLAEASEPTADGTNKFHLTTKGQKHTFKASSSAERDSWVAQIKAGIEEAKGLVETVKESETYKKTLESLKPTPPAKKEEKKVEEAAPKEEAAEAAAAPAEEAKEEKKEEPKRRSASRKRASIFGNFIGKKSEKAEEKKDDKPAEAAATEAPAEEAPAEAAAVPEVAAAETAVTDAPAAEAEAPAEAKAETKEAPAAKPKATKRSSVFGMSFGKKKEEKKVEETPAEAAPVSETAPVIPAVETTEPLSTDVAETPAAPAETADAAPATNGETKKEVKSDKRKSSLPFALGKLRDTIKGKGKSPKPADKAKEEPAEAEAAKDAEPAVAEEAPKPAEPEAVAPIVEDVPADKPIATTPAVTAAA